MCVGLALDEEANPQALTAVCRQHQRLTEVVHTGRVAPLGQEWLLEFGRDVHQRQAGRSADHFAVVQRQHNQAAPGAGIVGQVVGLVLRGAVVKVGELAEHSKAQASEVIDVRRDSGTVQQAYFHVWRSFCRCG